MSKRNPDASKRHVRQLIFVRDKGRCRWCHELVSFKDMVLAHGIAHADAPLLDEIDNWFTCCRDCNSVGRWSAPPLPVAIEEASVPQLEETNAKLQAQIDLITRLLVPTEPASVSEPVFDLDICQAKGARCELVGCQVPSCANYANFAYSKGKGEVVHEYNPYKTQW